MNIRMHIQTGWLAALLIGWSCLLAGCSDSAGDEPNRQVRTEDVLLQVAGLTRAYSDEEMESLKGTAIQLFLKSEDESANPSVTGPIGYGGTDGGDIVWNSTLYVKAGANYKVFGFMPAGITSGTDDTGDAPSVTVTENKATLSIKKMSTISKHDVCVIIGARGGLAENETVISGSFDYTAEYIEGKGYGLSLLADHIYSAVSFKFLLNSTATPDYSKLRKIKLKKVVLKNSLKSVDAAITLNLGNQTNTIGSVTYTPIEGSDPCEVMLFESSDGEELSTTANEDIHAVGYFANIDNNDASGISLESTYDVYDNNGKLIREDCQAVNKIGSVLSSVSRGTKMTLTVTVNPTYLYVLSNEDSGDITVTVGD